MDKINSNVIDFSPAEGPAGLSVGQVYIDLDGTLKRGIFAGQSAASFEAVRQANNERYAASGFVHFGKHRNVVVDPSMGTPVNEGVWCYYSSVGNENSFRIGIADGVSSMEGKSKTQHPIINIAGVIYELSQMHGAAPKQNLIKFPQAPDGKTTYHKTKGEVKAHVDTAAAFIYANQSDNIEVVTDRVDMWGFEAYLEEVTTTDPFVYPNGLIQSRATTMNGISTSASNRPVTYYAVFDGDTGSKGKGLDVTKLSYVQLATILGDHKHNLYYLADGRLVQWRLRQRTIAGAGNGDWFNIESHLSNDLLFSLSPTVKVSPQGMRDTKGDKSFVGNVNGWNPKQDFNGLFVSIQTQLVGDFSASTNGECYFLVCGTVNRLNQGAYHPSFNPSGAKFWTNTKNGGGAYWYVPSAGNNNVSTALCFNQVEAGTTGVVGARNQSGYIGDSSGRPDGHFYDAIYADGHGGVCRDMRYSAYGVDLVDFAEADQRVKNGTYRGFEKPLFTKFTSVYSGYLVSSNEYNSSYYTGPKRTGSLLDFFGAGMITGTPVIVYQPSSGRTLYGKISSANGHMKLTKLPNNRSLGNNSAESQGEFGNADIVYIAVVTDRPSSVGGSFLQTDVIGNPENILATPALANGWQGSWIPWIPDNTASPSQVRKVLKDMGQAYSDNNGSSWLNSPWGLGGVTNAESSGGAVPANTVVIRYYQAFAKQTENAVNAVVYGGAGGVGEVSSTSWNAVGNGMVLLAESCAGVILKSNNGYQDIDMGIAVTKKHLIVGSKLGADPNQRPEHFAIAMMAPQNNSPAFKALNYNVNLNQQAFIQYAYTELKHNGTNWGDDGKVTIVDNQATKTDLNGSTVLVGTARLREPLGWLTQSSQPRNASRTGLRISFNQWTKDVKPLEERGGIYGK